MNSIGSTKFESTDKLVGDFLQITEGTYAQLNGIKLTRMEEGYAEGEIQIDKQHLNSNGVMHGGVASALADTVAIWGCIYLYKTKKIATVNLNVSFLRPVKWGTITSKCRALSHGKSVSQWKAELVDDSGNVFADATITYSILK